MDTPRAFKDDFDLALAERLASDLQAVYPAFARAAFVQQVQEQIAPLELKARVAAFAVALRAHLPPDYRTALAILSQILGDELPDEQGMFDLGYHLMPVAAFVEQYGPAHPADFVQSLTFLHALTRRHTAEFALRPFLHHAPNATLAVLHQWAQDSNAHVRRAASESTRPRLPWATQLPAFIADPAPVLALLERLQHDPSPYVRKSVANNLNDIARDHPQQVLDTAARWLQHANHDTPALLRHALRGLLKRGDPAALALFAYAPPSQIRCTLTLGSEQVPIGASLPFTITLHNLSAHAQPVLLDYRLHMAGAGSAPRSKVFKLRSLTLAAGAQHTLTHQHPFRVVTVRRYYAGPHRLAVQVNGVVLAHADFTVLAPPVPPV